MAENITGYTQAELSDMNFYSFFREDYIELVKQRGFDRQKGLKVPKSYEVPIISKDGMEKWMLFTGDFIVYEGKPGVVGTAFDITERKKVEAELQNANQQRYNQAKEIAGGIAHEIYNALFPATSTLDKLRERLALAGASEIERNQKLIELAITAVNRAVDLTEVVTQFSRLESQKEQERINLKKYVSELVRDKQAIERDKIALTIDIDGEINIGMNRMQLYSLMNNLINNAIEALAEKRDKRILVWSRREGGQIKVVVEDNGPGIPQDILQSIFNPFFSTKPRTGTGLGLAICKKIVNIYGGDITVFSRLDKGTKFIILIPSVE